MEMLVSAFEILPPENYARWMNYVKLYAGWDEIERDKNFPEICIKLQNDITYWEKCKAQSSSSTQQEKGATPKPTDQDNNQHLNQENSDKKEGILELGADGYDTSTVEENKEEERAPAFNFSIKKKVAKTGISPPRQPPISAASSTASIVNSAKNSEPGGEIVSEGIVSEGKFFPSL
jgi:hypothetical protein